MQRLLLERNRVDPAALQPAVDALDAGELVVVPTESVYLLASRAENASRLLAAQARLAEGEVAATPQTIWLGSPRMAEAVQEYLPLPAQRLAARYWPGPLRLRVPRAAGLPELCVPAEPVTQALIEGYGGPLLALELPGPEPCTDAVRAKRTVRERLAEVLPRLLLDTGATAYGTAPTRLAVAAFALRELQRGPLERRKLIEAATLRISFVCTGNICRSPLAAALLETLARRDAAAQLGEPNETLLTVTSCGVSALTGSSAPREIFDVAATLDATAYLERHRASQADVAELAKHDLILVATREHHEILRRRAPELEPRLALLDPGGKDVRDPYMESRRVHEQVAQTIQRALQRRFFEQANVAAATPRTTP